MTRPTAATLTRRSLLAGLVAAPFVITRRAHAWAGPVLTPPQTEGPFYPKEPPIESDADLTTIAGRAAAKGEVIEVTGQVYDHRGVLLPGAKVELWQANAAGRYAHPLDGESSGPLDQGFQGWGKVIADRHGQFSFRTIVPGTYLAARDWRRPPHLHFKITGPQGPTLTTQTYFKGNPLNAKDGILQALPKPQRQIVTIDFKKGLSGAPRGHVGFYLPPN